MASLPPPQLPTPPKRSVVLILGAVVALGLIAGGVVVAIRGDREEPKAAPTTPTTVGATLVITTPENPETTVVATVEETVAPAIGPTPGVGEIVVADDTGLFQVIAPDTFEVDTAPVDILGGSAPSVTAAGNIDLYDAGYDETGYTVFAFDAAQVPDSVSAAVYFLDQLGTDCDNPQTLEDLETAIGPARHVVGEACGPNAANVVVLSIDETNSGYVFVVIAQGPAGVEQVTTLAKAVLESVWLN